eukprot:548411-Karenia_brevis.AAC.1
MDVLLKRLKKNTIKNDFLFSETQEDLLKHFKSALQTLVQKGVSLYVLRHTGPSADWLAQRPSRQEIKKRGRWIADSSVQRYEKGAKTMMLAHKICGPLQTHLNHCEKILPQVMSGHVAPLMHHKDP